MDLIGFNYVLWQINFWEHFRRMAPFSRLNFGGKSFVI